ncbi:Nudix hydrolase 6 [Cardamine amara subsp. amara]|uniref:Nudix hydrolase n=1 Tax=Cardamine amara subsp. amara TaxID=228776 RepID=A0ABD0ZAX5_CARAN
MEILKSLLLFGSSSWLIIFSASGYKTCNSNPLINTDNTHFSSSSYFCSMYTETQETNLLQGIEDNYGGVKVNLTEPMTVESFASKLRASLQEWKKKGKKGIWIKLANGLEDLIAPAKAEGFEYHHAERDFLMLVSWISDLPSTIPANASHRIGIGAFVLNKKTREVLVVQEIDGHFKGTGVWKLPTGVIQEGENIWEGVLREVEEETGIKTKFVEALALRESHKSFLETKSDIFFLCELEPITFEIKKQESEILAAKWMPIEEYVNQPWNQTKELFRFMANICLKRSQDMEYVGFSKVVTTTSRGKESYMYCNTDHANLLNATRGLTSTSTSR